MLFDGKAHTTIARALWLKNEAEQQNTAFNLSFNGGIRLVYFFFISCAPKSFSHSFEMHFIVKPWWLHCLGLQCPFSRKGVFLRLKKIYSADWLCFSIWAGYCCLDIYLLYQQFKNKSLGSHGSEGSRMCVCVAHAIEFKFYFKQLVWFYMVAVCCSYF